MEFSIVPVGAGSSLSRIIAEVLEVVDSSGLPYKITPMGTVVEGEWGDVMGLVERCHNLVLRDETRVLTSIRIDDRKEAFNRLDGKIRSVEEKLFRSLGK